MKLTTEYPGGTIIFTGVNAGQTPILIGSCVRYIVIDDIDEIPWPRNKRGYPVKFNKRKALLKSIATNNPRYHKMKLTLTLTIRL